MLQGRFLEGVSVDLASVRNSNWAFKYVIGSESKRSMKLGLGMGKPAQVKKGSAEINPVCIRGSLTVLAEILLQALTEISKSF
jgi:hypothetical protein